MKLVERFPCNNDGVLKVCTDALKHLWRQPRKKLIHEGTKQLWKWLIVSVMNGEYLDWNPGVALISSKTQHWPGSLA